METTGDSQQSESPNRLKSQPTDQPQTLEFGIPCMSRLRNK
jgi:hypothetical protein